MAIQIADAIHLDKIRQRAILEMLELQVFGGINNPLSMHFAFETGLSVDEVRKEALAIRSAIAGSDLKALAEQLGEIGDE